MKGKEDCRTSYTIGNAEFVDDEECGGVNGFGGVSAEGGGVINEMAMHVGRRPDSFIFILLLGRPFLTCVNSVNP